MTTTFSKLVVGTTFMDVDQGKFWMKQDDLHAAEFVSGRCVADTCSMFEADELVSAD